MVEAKEKPLFFSLMDYLNNYFTSNDPKKISEFYNFFSDKSHLIDWMRQRPKGVSNTYEIDGDNDIIVVIPTSNVDGEYAQECITSIFKSFKIIFVESGENPDPYFNYSHNCNIGIKKAMEYHPKWVVLSNDDVILHDDYGKLKSQLNSIRGITDVVFTTPTNYHSYKIWISRIRSIFFLRNFFSKERRYVELLRRFKINFVGVGSPDVGIRGNLYNKVYFKKLFSLLQVGSFAIFSSDYVSRCSNEIFDEIFINHMEDMDLSLRLHVDKSTMKNIDYNIDDRIGSTIGRGEQRKLRSIASQVYFMEKYKKLL